MFFASTTISIANEWGLLRKWPIECKTNGWTDRSYLKQRHFERRWHKSLVLSQRRTWAGLLQFSLLNIIAIGNMSSMRLKITMFWLYLLENPKLWLNGYDGISTWPIIAPLLSKRPKSIFPNKLIWIIASNACVYVYDLICPRPYQADLYTTQIE